MQNNFLPCVLIMPVQLLVYTIIGVVVALAVVVLQSAAAVDSWLYTIVLLL